MLGGLRSVLLALAASLALVLAGCADRTPSSGGSAQDVGNYKVGDPYQIGGKWYYPSADYAYTETGIASWYGPGFNGKTTANGEIFDESQLTGAHKTLPLPSMVRITNLDNGRSIKLRINDRGPFSNGRIVDVSRKAAQLLDFERAGTAKVRVEVLEEESRQLAAIAQGKTPDGAAAPQPAPRVDVAAEPLPDSSPPPAQTPTPAPRETSQPQVPQTGDLTVSQVTQSSIYVQAGSFSDLNNANSLAQRLQGIGMTAIQEAWVNGQKFYRVRLPAGSVNEADSLLERLYAQGYTDARVVVD